ncbi:MAG TPA: ATP-binding protein [Cyclobacteriaceae bacterium]|nr:ATP-binding protein [Cyclobacteriaceae bacterium]
MLASEFSEEKILSILKQLDFGTNPEDLCREHNISLNTLFGWKARHGEREDLIRRLTDFEEENYRLKSRLSDIIIQREAKDAGDADRIYRIMASNIPGTAITILDRDERYLLAEGDFLEKMGYVKETMPGKKISEIITPENYIYYQEVIRRAFEGETILVERQTLSGFYSLMKVVPLRDGSDDIFAIMFVLIDVTPLKEVQVALTKANEELEKKVQTRTEQLEEVNKQLESFTYSVSHDLRAPLRSVSGYAAILKEDFASKINDPEFDRLSDLVIESAKRMNQLVSDLLDFARIGRKELSIAKVEIHVLVKALLADFMLQEPSRKIDIELDLLEPAAGDYSLLRQVWTNLLSNALKYSRKKEVAKIHITCTRDNEMICYSVKDNGAGFDMKYVGKLFSVFQRLHKTTDFEGTGVGLALVKNIVQRHGGKIWVEAEVGKGAEFYFTLPVA